MATSILFTLLLILPHVTMAVPLPRCPTTNLAAEDQARMVHKILLLGADGRLLIEEYAATKHSGPNEIKAETARLKSEFSGLGLLNCGGAISTAQLTGANDVITFAGHTQFGPNCEDYRSRRGRCSFKPVFLDHPAVIVDFRSIHSRCEKGNQRVDWAVAKLDRPIQGARYFKVPKADTRWRRPTEVIQLSARHRKNFRNGDSRPTIQHCSVRVANLVDSGDRHDCDTDGMASGSAHLDLNPSLEPEDSPSSSYTIMAINVASGPGKDTPANTNGDEQKRYDFNAEAGQYNASVPVAGEFRQAILKAIGK